jgi:hypothetical protein
VIEGFPTPLWLIEGFYGPPWPDAARLANYRLMGKWGYEGAIYAPKADRSLRSEWRRPLRQTERLRLKTMASTAAASGLQFGVGLSPMNVWNDWSDETRDHLTAKLADLHASGCEVLSLQFDDMRGDVPHLARLQAEIIGFVGEHWSGSRLIICPTYYSDDPILGAVFGDPPANYLEDLARNLPAHVDIFWTGPKVVSTLIDVEHILKVTARMGRRPFLWDNYPVNDGARTSRHLFLKAPESRHALMSGTLAGYAANPMLQPHLSQLPLRALAALVHDQSSLSSEALLKLALRDCVDPLSAPLFVRHADDFARRGLDNLAVDEAERISEAFSEFDDPHATEVARWLAGEFAFDPACLTD